MSADVIQHTKPRRKRAGAWSWTARHIVLLGLAVVAIIVASWLAPDLAPPPPAPAPAVNQQAATPESVAEEPPVADILVNLGGPPAPRRERQVSRNTGVPLDAVVEPRDDYEILSAAELAGISQARD